MKIEAHKLTGGCVEYLRCTKCSCLLELVDTIVLHATDGSNTMSSAHSVARSDTSVSAHLVVARSGQVIQLLPFNVRVWHAGRLHRRGNCFFSWFNKEYPPGEVFTTVENGRAVYYHRHTRMQTDRVAEIYEGRKTGMM